MEGGKGGNSYWPGFVDALTNVVIAMIFVIVVLAIALSFAAQLMGKKLAEQYIAAAKASAAAIASAAAAQAPGSPPLTALPSPESQRAGRTRIAVKAGDPASSPAETHVVAARNVLQLDFPATAFTLDPQAAEQLKAALKGADQRARVVITATGPDMQLSANQRAAYLRVMAVRNVLIGQGFPAGSLQVSIDTQTRAAAAAVNVSFQEKR